MPTQLGSAPGGENADKSNGGSALQGKSAWSLAGSYAFNPKRKTAPAPDRVSGLPTVPGQTQSGSAGFLEAELPGAFQPAELVGTASLARRKGFDG